MESTPVNKPLLAKDIKYKGILDYQSLRMVAWILFALSQLGFVFKTGAFFIPEAADKLNNWALVVQFLGVLPMPLFLIANFSLIFNFKGTIKELLINHLKMTGFMTVLFLFLVSFYMLRSDMVFKSHSIGEAYLSVNRVINDDLPFFLSLNLFTDMLLCSSFYFFLVYVPKNKRFQGKNIIWFRLFAIIPVLYALIGTIIKNCINLRLFTLPFFLVPLLAKNSFICFLAFMLVMFLAINRKRLIIKKGYTEKEYNDFLKTRRNSFHFSLSVSIVFVFMSIIDIIVSAIIIRIIKNPESINDYFTLESFGIGSAMPLIFSIPFILLFNYRNEPKMPKLDPLIPLIGVGLTGFTVIEGFFELLIKIKQG